MTLVVFVSYLADDEGYEDMCVLDRSIHLMIISGNFLFLCFLMHICNSPVNLNKQQHKQGDNSKLKEGEQEERGGHTILYHITHDLQRCKLLFNLG